MAHQFRRREVNREGVRLSSWTTTRLGRSSCAARADENGRRVDRDRRGGSQAVPFILPDLRGHGASTRRPADLSHAAFVDDVAAVIRRVSPGGPVTLASQSISGHTAIIAAAG